jgi:hypothetical protein
LDIPWVKLIWESYYEDEVPHAAKACGSYWWKDLIKLMDQYRGFTKPEVQSGETVLFWSDSWELDGSRVPLRDRFPRLFSFAKDSKVSVREMVQLQNRAEEFHLPLSSRAYDEFLLLQGWLDNVHLQPLGADIWSCVGGDYKANAYYASLYNHVVVDPQFQWIWKSKCIMKIKMFSWLMLSDRLNTKDLLQRRHWNVTNDYSCVLCPGHHHEDRDHLFFNCVFSSRVWIYLQIQWGTSGNMVQTAEVARKRFGHFFFTEVVALACWHIWKVRNARVFENVQPRFAVWRRNFIEDLSLHAHRFKENKQTQILQWISNLH